VLLEVADDVPVLAAEAVQVDAFNVGEAEQLAHRRRDTAPGFVARTGTLGDPERLPELLLGQSAALAQLARRDGVLVALPCHVRFLQK